MAESGVFLPLTKAFTQWIAIQAMHSPTDNHFPVQKTARRLVNTHNIQLCAL